MRAEEVYIGDLAKGDSTLLILDDLVNKSDSDANPIQVNDSRATLMASAPVFTQPYEFNCPFAETVNTNQADPEYSILDYALAYCDDKTIRDFSKINDSSALTIASNQGKIWKFNANLKPLLVASNFMVSTRVALLAVDNTGDIVYLLVPELHHSMSTIKILAGSR